MTESKSKINWKKQITVPNLISLIRLLAIPFLGYEIYQSKGFSTLSVVLFAVIWATDFLDGYVARKFNQVSDIGKLLDPMVDKVLHTVTAVMMTVVGRVPVWVMVTLVIKEILMVLSALYLLSRRIIVSSRWYGKLATVLVALAFGIVFLLSPDYAWLSGYIFIVPMVMLYFAMFAYLYRIIFVKKHNLLHEAQINSSGFRDISPINIKNR